MDYSKSVQFLHKFLWSTLKIKTTKKEKPLQQVALVIAYKYFILDTRVSK